METTVIAVTTESMVPGIRAILDVLPQDLATALLIGTALISYILGCLNGAVLISKYVLHDDVREHGSGNGGLTNFYRTFGGKWSIAVIVADMVKVYLAVFFCSVAFSVVLTDVPVFVSYWSGLFCMLGHMFPIMFKFHGGKGILSGGALVLLLDWRVALAAWGLFIVIAALTRLISLASCCAGLSLPISAALVYQSWSIFWLAFAMSALILLQHRANVLRLVQGKESKFSFRQKRKSRTQQRSED